MHASIKIIKDEHATLAAMLRSIQMLIERGPGNNRGNYFDALRAMLFYIDEFPERLPHTKESNLLFPKIEELAPESREILQQLDSDHAHGKSAVRELQHLLLAWELMGDSRHSAFQKAAIKYLQFYLEHMNIEETEVIPLALRLLNEDQWRELDAAFMENCDPFTGKYPRSSEYDLLYQRIVSIAPEPIGLGS